ncbi:hypothetical protein MPER_05769 [Moniliophthora perniciosa FA553]|nr:hypothetical protein MPER_05769 [Moniliophthora perniciosa FA553]
MITLYAAHEYMMSDPVRFEAAPDYQFSQMFIVRPQEMVERIETVSAWVKQPDSPIVAFAKKAKDIRSVNRRIQEKRRYEEPQSLPVTYTWTKTDKIIIKFLLDNLRTPIGNQRDPFVIGASHIVQKISSDVIEVADEDIHRLLVDLGVLAPWADIVPLRYDLDLDVEGRREAKGAEMVKKVLESPGHSSTGSPEDFHMKDPLESLRHDFGNLPVYVIDDLTASELDDGVSIESVLGEPGSYWVHVHIY